MDIADAGREPAGYTFTRNLDMMEESLFAVVRTIIENDA